MKKVMTGGLVALLLAALVGLLSMASIGSAAPTARQYNKPVLTLSVSYVATAPDGTPLYYYLRVDGAGYAEGDVPSGTVTYTCTKGTDCASSYPSTWGPLFLPVGPSGTFSTVIWSFNCPSNVKSAIATDTNGVKSNSAKGAC
jgi:hypothetical protein